MKMWNHQSNFNNHGKYAYFRSIKLRIFEFIESLFLRIDGGFNISGY